MTVESNDVIAIFTLRDWLKRLALVFQPMKKKPKQISPCTRDFRAFWASYRQLLGIVIGSSCCLLLLWLVGVIALGLVFQQSFEKRSNNIREKISRWLCRRKARVSRDQGKITPSIAPSSACDWFESKRFDWPSASFFDHWPIGMLGLLPLFALN